MRTINAMGLLTGMLIICAFQAARGEGEAVKEMAVTCPQCETTWVSDPNQLGEIAVYRTEKSTECEGCKSAVANYFKIGVFEHACKTCSDLAACKIQQVNTDPMPPYPSETANSAMAPKCKAVWVKKPGNKGIFTAYSSEKTQICCSCQDLAIDMINNGKTTEKCAECSNELMAGTPAFVLMAMAFAPSY